MRMPCSSRAVLDNTRTFARTAVDAAEAVRHGEAVRRIAEAVRARDEAERMLAAAVAAARSAGLSWAGIGACVGITGEAVRQRYSGPRRPAVHSS